MSHRGLGSAVALAGILLVCIALPASSVEKGVAPGTKAVLEVEYFIEGKFSSSGDLASTDWKVSRHFMASYEIDARELAKFGTLDTGHTVAMQDDTAALNEQAQDMAMNNADMMARAQAIADACGDDEACITQKVMELSQSSEAQGGIQQLSTDGKAMDQSVKAYDAKSPPRYQLWNMPEGKSPNGHADASVNESLVTKTYYPICESSEVCTSIRDRQGKQQYNTAEETFMALAMVEIDTAENLISVSIPWPMVMVTVQEATQDGTGSKAVMLVTGQELDLVNKHTQIISRPIKGSYKDQSGEDSFQLPNLDDYNAPIDVKMRWHFKVL